MDIPLSARLKDTPVATLCTDMHKLLTQSDDLDAAKVPLTGRIVDLHSQKEQLVLVDEGANRLVAIVSQDENQNYHACLSSVVPEGISLDEFHAGENGIYLQFPHQQWMAEYVKQADGAWQFSYVMESLNNTVNWYGVQ